MNQPRTGLTAGPIHSAVDCSQSECFTCFSKAAESANCKSGCHSRVSDIRCSGQTGVQIGAGQPDVYLPGGSTSFLKKQVRA